MNTETQLDIQTLEQKTMELALNGMLWIDPKGCIRHANEAACQILEYSYEELITKTIYEIDPSTSEDNLEKEYLSVIRANKRYHFEARMIAGSGRQIYSDVTVFHVQHKDLDLYCSYFFDITVKKEQNKELKKIKYAIEHNSHSFIWINSNGQFSYGNRAVCQCLGYAQNEFYDLRVMDIVSDDTALSWTEFWQELKRNKSLVFETVLERKNGDTFPVEVSAGYFEIDGHEQCFSCIRDITEKHDRIAEKEKLKYQLGQAQKLESIGTLAAGIAHDFNNILSGIFGYSQLAELDIQKPEKILKHVSKIRQGAQRASELVQQILTFSRQTEFKKEPLRIYPIVNEVLKLLRSSIPANIIIENRIESKNQIMADPTRIHQVLMNLCTNAYHAMKKTGGKLTVRLLNKRVSSPKGIGMQEIPEGDYLMLSVGDTGCGMDTALLKKVFEPYFTTKDKGEGTGLGLALVQAIVAEHDAFIDVDTAPNNGTTISIYFPMIDQPEIEKNEEPSQDALFNGGETIMVVDDEAAIREIYNDLLAMHGYDVRLFEDGQDAFNAFHSDPHLFDLIITDMEMPGMTGSELANKIHAFRNEIPILLSSGFDQVMCRENDSLDGIKGFLKKPTSEFQLLKTVRSALDRSEETVDIKKHQQVTS